MPVELTTVPRVPILRTGHYELESGPVDFALEHLTAAVTAFENDPAVLAPRVRLELSDAEAHLDLEGITSEAGGAAAGPAVGWADGLAVEGNTLYADVHVPSEVAAALEWAFPGRSIEGLFGYTTATGHTHDFMATGLLLCGTSWPGVTTLPDFREVQAEFMADVAEGTIDVPTYAAASGDGAEAAQRARVVSLEAPTGRAPREAELVTAGLNVGDLRMRWYAAEGAGDLEDLPDSYDFWSWYVTEVRALDDGSLVVYVIDENDGREWGFEVTSVEGGQVAFASPVEVVRPDPVPAAARAADRRPRPALARWTSRADSRTVTASAPNTQEDDTPMTDAQRRALALAYGLEADATQEQVDAAVAAGDPPERAEAEPPEPAPAPEEAEDEAALAAAAAGGGRTATVSREVLAGLQADAAAGREARETQVRAERDSLVTAAIRDGRITPAEAGLTRGDDGSLPDGWRADLDAAPEVTARRLAALEPGKYPGGDGASARVAQQGDVTSGQVSRVMASFGVRPRQEVKA